MLVKRLMIIVLLVIILAVLKPQEALACSGYPYFGVEDLPSMDLLVKATVIDADDRGQNAILRVEEYYKGSGDRFLAVVRYPVALGSGAMVRGYDTGCLYSGRGHHWIKGSQGYFGLMPNEDGTFTDSNYGTAHFYPVDGKIIYQEGATEGYALEWDEPLEITEDEFIQKMLEVGKRETPLIPNESVWDFYPLMRYLNITTENGTRYQVNPDRSVMEVPDDAPLAISPDGAHVAFALDDQTIGFQYIWTENYTNQEEYLEDGGMDDPTSRFIEGQALAFSNDSNLVAVWDQNHLAIYLLTNRLLDYGYGEGLTLVELANVKLNSASNPAIVRWSPDSSTLIWIDDSGLWHWDLVDAAEPQQLLPSVDKYDVAWLEVSTYGRYVRLGSPEEWLLIDSVTLEKHENLLIAPNEQFLLRLSSTPMSDDDVQACAPPLRENCVTTMQARDLIGTFPYTAELLGIVYPFSVVGNSWHPAIGGTDSYGGRFLGNHAENMRQVAFDMQYQQVAILEGDYNIYFDFYDSDWLLNEDYLPYLDVLQLEDELDSPIANIEWGQFIFFDEYRLATSEYFPH